MLHAADDASNQQSIWKVIRQRVEKYTQKISILKFLKSEQW